MVYGRREAHCVGRRAMGILIKGEEEEGKV